MITEIISELNLENGSNYKKAVLEAHKDNELLKRVLQMAYDRVKFTYGITMKNISYNILPEDQYTLSLEDGLDFLENNLCTRANTGHIAIKHLQGTLSAMGSDDAKIIELIINRDLRINMGRSNINKVIKNLITKPAYMRCSLSDKLDRIKYPAIVQTKADGTYRSLIVDNGEVILMSRSGEQDDFPNFFDKMSLLPDGVYIGELLIRSLPGAKNRLKANGLINSDTEQEDMFIQVWDYLTLSEWKEKKSTVDYIDRLNKLTDNIHGCDSIEVINGRYVDSYEYAMKFYKEQIALGLEGAVLKNLDTPFKDHTSPTQIKLKEEAVAEFILTGVEEGKGRLLGHAGAILFESACGQVKGKAGIMGGDDFQKMLWETREDRIGDIFSGKYNGVTKGKGSDTYNLMFAKLVELRPEKDEADDLEYIQNALV